MKRWKNCEVSRSEAPVLKDFLATNNIQFETCEAYNLIHFEVLADDLECEHINKFISDNFQ